MTNDLRPRIRALLHATSALLLGMSVRAESAPQPNIVFLFSDDHAPHAIGAYEGWLAGVDPTPAIDDLAADGMLFRNSFCTNSICGPSRAVIITGKHSHKNGFMNNGNNFDGSQQTFPKLLQKAGYETAVLGKWHLKSDPQGFDLWKILPGQGLYYNPDLKTPEGKITIEGHCTDIVTDIAVDWLKSGRDKNKPFLLMCQHKAPHRNWMPAARHLSLYADMEMPEPPTLFDQWEDNASPAHWQELEIDGHMHLNLDLFYKLRPEDDYSSVKSDRSAWVNLKRMTEGQKKAWYAHYEPLDRDLEKRQLSGKELVRWKYQRYVKNYLRCVRGVDESVARVRQTLKELGLEKNTIVVYSSDQGFYIGDHGWYDKRWMYEESFQMPLIISWPGVTKPGSTSDLMVQNIDYAETFLEAAGAPIPSDMQGMSLVPLLRGESPDYWRKALYYHYYEYPSVHMVPRQNGIRTERYKLINFYEFGEEELYDLENDPDELTNLASNPEYAGKLAELRGRLQGLVEKYEDDTVTDKKPEAWIQEMRTQQYRVEDKL